MPPPKFISASFRAAYGESLEVSYTGYEQRLKDIYIDFDRRGYEVISVTPIVSGYGELAGSAFSANRPFGSYSLTRGAVVMGKYRKHPDDLADLETKTLSELRARKKAEAILAAEEEEKKLEQKALRVTEELEEMAEKEFEKEYGELKQRLIQEGKNLQEIEQILAEFAEHHYGC